MNHYKSIQSIFPTHSAEDRDVKDNQDVDDSYSRASTVRWSNVQTPKKLISDNRSQPANDTYAEIEQMFASGVSTETIFYTLLARGISPPTVIAMLLDHRVSTEEIRNLLERWLSLGGAIFESAIRDTTQGAPQEVGVQSLQFGNAVGINAPVPVEQIIEEPGESSTTASSLTEESAYGNDGSHGGSGASQEAHSLVYSDCGSGFPADAAVEQIMQREPTKDGAADSFLTDDAAQGFSNNSRGSEMVPTNHSNPPPRDDFSNDGTSRNGATDNASSATGSTLQGLTISDGETSTVQGNNGETSSEQ